MAQEEVVDPRTIILSNRLLQLSPLLHLVLRNLVAITVESWVVAAASLAVIVPL